MAGALVKYIHVLGSDDQQYILAEMFLTHRHNGYFFYILKTHSRKIRLRTFKSSIVTH